MSKTNIMNTANTAANTAANISEKSEKSETNEMNEIEYLKQLNPLENEALIIAKRQLKTSFDLGLGSSRLSTKFKTSVPPKLLKTTAFIFISFKKFSNATY